MGIQGLWGVLSETAQADVPTLELAGKTIAVDLSSWIVEFSTSPAKSQVPNILIRNLFFRVSELLKCGLHLVFVLDGIAPELKADELARRQQAMYGASTSASSASCNRTMLNMSAAKCVELLKAMGLPCVYSQGEAEATCAYLNKEKLVDGCMTGDGDFFCYGGLSCYRRLRKDGKNYVVDVYDIGTIEEKLGLGQAEMIALALLLGSDYDKQGVKNIGKQKALPLLNTFRTQGVDALERISGWHGNTELDSIENAMNNPGPWVVHCKQCQHVGRVSTHQGSGCVVCAMVIGCQQSCDILCDCDWHTQRRHEEKYKLEVSVRRKALDNCSDRFPDPRIIHEYQQGGEENSRTIKPADLRRTRISVNPLCVIIQSQLHWDQGKALEKVVPLLINIQLRGQEIGLANATCDLQYSPIRILKECQDNHRACYEVGWREISDYEASPKKESVTLKTEKALFHRNFPRIVEQFTKLNTAKKAAKAAKKPRKKCEASTSLAGQSKITSFTKVRKRLFPTEEIDGSGAFSNITNSKTVPKTSDTCDTNNDYDLPDLVGSSDLQPLDTSPTVRGDGHLRRSPRRVSGEGCSLLVRTEDAAIGGATGFPRTSREDSDLDGVTTCAVSRGKPDGNACNKSKRKLPTKDTKPSTIKKFFSMDKP